MPAYQNAKVMSLHFSEHDRHKGKPLYDAIVEKCRELKIAERRFCEAWKAMVEPLKSTDLACSRTTYPSWSTSWIPPRTLNAWSRSSRK